MKAAVVGEKVDLAPAALGDLCCEEAFVEIGVRPRPEEDGLPFHAEFCCDLVLLEADEVVGLLDAGSWAEEEEDIYDTVIESLLKRILARKRGGGRIW